MALVDLSLMRIAIFEMNFAAEAIPPAVAINEAVELAKKYGTAESAKFVNGILDQVGRAKA
jgi:N utilization substance protein B